MKNEKHLTKFDESTVISSEVKELPDHTLKTYNLYVCNKPEKRGASGRMIPAQGRPEAPLLLAQMAASLGLEPSEKEIKALAEKENNGLYLWDDGGVCAIARIAFIGERYARINTVYTFPEKRGRGYAAALVSALAEKIVGDGLIPTVLADENNPVSNGLYLSLGFATDGKIYEYLKNGVAHSENAIFYIR